MDVNSHSIVPRPKRWNWRVQLRVLLIIIPTGIVTFFGSALCFAPHVKEGQEEIRCSYYPRFSRAALAEIESVPPSARAEKWPVVEKISPNITVIEFQTANTTNPPVRAALNGDDFQVIRVFVPRDIRAAVTDGRDDYTLEYMQSYLVTARAKRRWDWITTIGVWLVAWALLVWHFLPRLPVTDSEAIPQG